MKISRYIAVALCMLAASCAKENVGKDAGSNLVELTLEAYPGEDDPETKTLIGPDGSKVFWADGDQISLFFGNGDNGGSCFTTATGGETASFSGTLNAFTAGGEGYAGETTYFWGVYPYNTSTTCDNNSVTVNIPSIQLGVAGTFAPGVNVSVGRSENLKMGFYNVCSGFSFSVSTEGITEVLFKSKNEVPVVGDATVQFELGKPKVVNLANGSDEVRLFPDGSEFEVGKKYYLEFIPATLDGFTVTIYNSIGQEATFDFTTTREFTRSKFTNVNSLNTRVGEWTVRKDNITFEDPKFKAYCVQNFDTNGDGEISFFEASVVSTIDCHSSGISSMNEIRYFSALTSLSCYGNKLSSLDISNNTALTSLVCYRNQITALDVRKNTALTNLECESNYINALDVSNNTSLTTLRCGSNDLATIDISKNTSLTIFDCNSNHLTNLDISKNTSLEVLYCGANQLTTLDISKNISLEVFACHYNQLTNLDVSSNTSLTSLRCDHNQLTSLDVSKNTNLQWLSCYNNQLTSLDVSKNTSLESLECTNNQLTSLDVSGNTDLEWIECHFNKLTNLDVSKLSKLFMLECHDNLLASLDVSKNINLELLLCSPMDDENGNNLLKTLYIYNGQYLEGVTYYRSSDCIPDETVITDGIPGGNEGVGEDDLDDKVTFADPIFKAYCVENFDTNGDGSISYPEAAEVTTIFIEHMNITSLDGIQSFTALTELKCAYNQLTSLDVSNNTALIHLDCYGNHLTSIDVRNNISLTHFGCGFNRLTSIDVSNNTALEYLDCKDSDLISLDVSKNAALVYLDCSNTRLTSLDLRNNIVLTSLNCNNCQLRSLNITNCVALENLACINNQLSSLDVSKNIYLGLLECSGNQLTSLDVNSNTALEYLYCRKNKLTSLGTSNNKSLIYLYCTSNQLTSLDVSHNPLESMDCFDNQLTSLDVSNNTSLTYLVCSNNPLTTLYIANGQEIPNITSNRSPSYIPDGANIIVKTN